MQSIMNLQVILPDEQKEQLMAEVHTTIVQAVEEARKDTGLDRPVLKKMEMIKYLGISYKTFSHWEAEGMPTIHMTGATLYSKAQVIQWLESRAI